MNRSRSWRYRVVDVFTTTALEGNPLAVFPEAEGLDDLTMQQIARELNLSETVFVWPPTRPNCIVGLRIFTPARELPFAGHPTIGASFVMLDEGIVPGNQDHFLLDERVGPMPIRVERGERPLIWLRTPPIEWKGTSDRHACAQALGLDVSDLLDPTPQLLDAGGNPTLLVPLKDKAVVDRLSLDAREFALIAAAHGEPMCVFAFTPTDSGSYSRMFAPEYGIIEDPATGSSTGPLAAYMMKHGLVSGTADTRFFSEQGTKMGRRSILYVHIHGEQGVDGIDVGGYVTPVAEGTMTLPGK